MTGVPESSGIVASRRYPGLYWTHGDSGNRPLLYAVRADGSLEGKPVRVRGATNVDWEDIASDDAGNLWIADIGNNFSLRTDLGVWVVPEPDPYAGQPSSTAIRYSFRYPEQTLFPSPRQEYDAEALFVASGRAYVLTKQHLGGSTVLYRMGIATGDGWHEVKRIDSYSIGGMVTAADASPDGVHLAVLTYGAVWLFRAETEEGWLRGKARWLPVVADQCEALALDHDGSILVTNESGSLFRIHPEEMIELLD